MSEWKTSGALKVVILVLAVLGGLAVLGIVGMALMHASMMGAGVC